MNNTTVVNTTVEPVYYRPLHGGNIAILYIYSYIYSYVTRFAKMFQITHLVFQYEILNPLWLSCARLCLAKLDLQ